MAPFTIVKKAVEKLIRSRIETDYLGSWVGGELEVYIKREYATAENSHGQTKAYVKAILNDQDTRYKLTTQFAFADLNGAIFDMPKPKANPAPRKRASSLYGAKMKHLESALSALNMLIDKGAEFPDAVIKVSESTGVDIEVLTAEYDKYWRAWSELSSAYRKTNPAKRPAPKKRALSRPSQVTKKAPSKRLVARRKVAAKKPVKGYFPNPGKDEFLVQVCSPISVQLASRKWTTVLKFKTEKEAKETALQMARIDRLDRSWRVMKK